LKKEKKKSILEILTEYVKEETKKHTNSYPSEYTPGVIGTLVVDYLMSNKMLVCAPRVKTYIDTISLTLNSNPENKLLIYRQYIDKLLK